MPRNNGVSIFLWGGVSFVEGHCPLAHLLTTPIALDLEIPYKKKNEENFN